MQIRTDLAEGTKDLYPREVNTLILPHLASLRLREVTVGRVDQFIKRQATASYAYSTSADANSDDSSTTAASRRCRGACTARATGSVTRT